MIKKIALLLCVLFILSSCASNVKPMTDYSEVTHHSMFYQNPLGVKGIGDPFILSASDGQYYLYATSMADGFKVWRSQDMIHWSELPYPCFQSTDSWESGDFWAPEVYEIEGKYYLYYTARWRDNGGLRLGAAVSDKPEGPFKALSDKPILDYGYAAIDSHLFIDDDKSKTMFFVRDCSENIVKGNRQSHIYAVSLNDDLITANGEPQLISKPEQEWELKSKPQWNEGPFVIKHDSKYYMMYSGDYYGGRNYSVGYAVADNLFGPYEKYDNNPILKADRDEISGTGHNMVLKGHDGQLYCVYHSHTYPADGGGDRQLCIDRLGFNPDGTLYIDGPTITPQLNPDTINLAQTAERSADGLTLTWITPVAVGTVALYGTGNINLQVDNEQIKELTLNDKEPLIITFSPREIKNLKLLPQDDSVVEMSDIVVLGE